MPYASKAQQGYFNANRKKLEAKGVDVGEWNKSSTGLNLPEKSPVAKFKAMTDKRKKISQ